MKKAIIIFFILNAVFIGQIFSHGDLGERIIAVSNEIKIAPDSAYLYVKRSKLYFQHEEYKRSIKDLDKSKILGYNSIEQKLLFAEVNLNLNAFEITLSYCEEILTNDPKNVRAIKVKAQTYLEQGQFQKSALAFEDVIHYSREKFPENYIDASRAWELLNDNLSYHRATEIVREGINKLGELISLYNRLIELAVKEKDYSAAIETQCIVIKLSPRKESAYYKLSELYLLNDNREKALVNLNLAKQHYNNLPARLQNTLYMNELIENIQSKEALLIRN